MSWLSLPLVARGSSRKACLAGPIGERFPTADRPTVSPDAHLVEAVQFIGQNVWTALSFAAGGAGRGDENRFPKTQACEWAYHGAVFQFQLKSPFSESR